MFAYNRSLSLSLYINQTFLVADFSYFSATQNLTIKPGHPKIPISLPLLGYLTQSILTF